MSPDGAWTQPLWGPVNLVIRGEWIEVSLATPVLRALVVDGEYFFDAMETSITTGRLSAGEPREGVIVLTGRRLGKEIHLEIDAGINIDAIWNALANAGSIPVGAPPRDEIPEI